MHYAPQTLALSVKSQRYLSPHCFISVDIRSYGIASHTYLQVKATSALSLSHACMDCNLAVVWYCIYIKKHFAKNTQQQTLKAAIMCLTPIPSIWNQKTAQRDTVASPRLSKRQTTESLTKKLRAQAIYLQRSILAPISNWTKFMSLCFVVVCLYVSFPSVYLCQVHGQDPGSREWDVPWRNGLTQWMQREVEGKNLVKPCAWLPIEEG